MFWSKKKDSSTQSRISQTETFPFQIENGRYLIESIKSFLKRKGLNRTNEDEDLYDKSQHKYDYYTQIEKWEVKCDEFYKIPLCWSESGRWYMLSGFFIKDDNLFAEIYDLQTGPPDFGHMKAEGVPIRVLLESYKLLIMQY